jgi:hypothetical protein
MQPFKGLKIGAFDYSDLLFYTLAAPDLQGRQGRKLIQRHADGDLKIEIHFRY